MAGYIGSIPVPQATQTREAFTATSNQTTFNTGGYTSGFIDVYMNGVKLAAADFTATNGSDVVLASGAAANDIVEVVAYTAFEVLNQNFTGTTTVEALTATGAISGTSADFDGGVTIDNITIDGAEIDLSAGDLLLDVAGDIKLDADGGDIRLLDGGTQFGKFTRSSGDFIISSSENDKDMKFAGADGGADITALTLDMSAAGAATFNSTVTADGLTVNGAALVQAGNSATATLSLNNANGSGTLSQLNLGYTADPDHGNIKYDGNLLFSTGGNTERMRISGANVGIGTSSPSYTLSVEKDVDTWVSRIYNTGSDADASGLLVRTDATAAHNANAFAVYADSGYKMIVKSDGNIGVNTTAPVDFGDNFKNLNLNGVKGGALSFTRGTNSATRQWDIYTSDSDQLIFYRGGSADGMVMKSDGNIGVNTSTPLSTFQVRGAGTENGSLRVGGNAASLGLELLYDQSGATVSYIQSNPTYTNSNSFMHIRVDGDANPNQLVLKGDGNVGIGTSSMSSYYSDRFVIYAGDEDGMTIVTGTGSQNYIMFADGTSGNARYRGYIGYDHSDDHMKIASAGTESIRLLSGGNLQKAGDSNSARIIPATDNAGYLGESSKRWQAVYAVSGSIQTSDRNLKTEITDSALGLDFVKALRPVSFKWISGGKHFEYDEDDDRKSNPTITDVSGKRNHYGLIAQEVKEVLGDTDFGGWVSENVTDENAMQSLRYDQFIAPLIKAVQELSEEVGTLKTRLTALEAN